MHLFHEIPASLYETPETPSYESSGPQLSSLVKMIATRSNGQSVTEGRYVLGTFPAAPGGGIVLVFRLENEYVT